MDLVKPLLEKNSIKSLWLRYSGHPTPKIDIGYPTPKIDNKGSDFIIVFY